jgi:RNA polymerase sigma factor (sigma-70 family)
MSSAQRGLALEEIANLYYRNYPQYLRVAEAVLGNAEHARDAVQDAFVAAIEHRADFRRTGSPDAWVWTCVVNKARDSARAGRRRKTIGRISPEGPHSATVADLDIRDELRRLPERQRLVLFLRYFGDLDYRTIATALRIREGTVAATLHKARRNLEQTVGDVHG